MAMPTDVPIIDCMIGFPFTDKKKTYEFIVKQTKDRKACLIFASSVKHGQNVTKVIEKIAGTECGFIDGETAGIFRDHSLQKSSSFVPSKILAMQQTA